LAVGVVEVVTIALLLNKVAEVVRELLLLRN
jgi:hypothetical protein